jgi:hypothetical protein
MEKVASAGADKRIRAMRIRTSVDMEASVREKGLSPSATAG